jgi:hypothetical protein
MLSIEIYQCDFACLLYSKYSMIFLFSSNNKINLVARIFFSAFPERCRDKINFIIIIIFK